MPLDTAAKTLLEAIGREANGEDLPDIDRAWDAAYEKHSDGDAGNTSDIGYAFLRALETPDKEPS